jgi:hypothetical protein
MKDYKKVPALAHYDLRQLAIIAQFFDHLGYPPTSRSDLLYRTSSMLADIIMKDERMQHVKVENYEQAIAILTTFGITWQQNSTGADQVRHNLSLDSVIDETTDSDQEYLNALNKAFSDQSNDDS